MLDKQQTCLNHDGITIKIILGSLIEEKTVGKDNFMNIFSYQVILVFCKIFMLLTLIRPILGHPLSMKITGFIHLTQKHLWDLMLKIVTELLSYIVIVQLFIFLEMDVRNLVLIVIIVFIDCYYYDLLQLALSAISPKRR